MLSPFIGELAAFATATSWAVSCQIYSAAGKRLSATGVTTLRLPLCVGLMVLLCLVTDAPRNTDPKVIGLLLASAFFGLAICDTLFYKSAMAIGPRLACLVQSLCACITAVLGYFFLDEKLGFVAYLGIFIAIGGVAFVLADGGNLKALPAGVAGRKTMISGCSMALVSAFALSLSLICLKQAILLDTSPVWATFVRLTAGSLILFLFAALRGAVKQICLNLIRNPVTWIMLPAGAVAGTFGIWMSGVAVQNTEAGIAATILALEPVMIIPVNAIWEKRLPSLRAVIGTLIAFAGVAIMLMR